MPKVKILVWKELTASDFYWINQPGLVGGGGQSYIDFDTSDISGKDWKSFFRGCEEGAGASGPYWTFSVHNLGPNDVQNDVKVGQRRATSFSIRSQKLPEHSTGGKRLHAWSPHYSNFPEIPPGLTGAEQVPFALIGDLRIFLIRDDDDTFWAGWTRLLPPGVSDDRFKEMFAQKSGLLRFGDDWEIDPSQPNWPFKRVNAVAEEVAADESAKKQNAEADTPEAPDDEAGLWDPADELDVPDGGISYSVQQIRKRNRAAAKAVRKLYNACQITGDNFIFKTKSGKPYLEVHHLVPLGAGGADSPHNMIVISAQVHKMLHHAEVSTIDLTNIKDDKLTISISGQPAVITWNPKHAELVVAHNST